MVKHGLKKKTVEKETWVNHGKSFPLNHHPSLFKTPYLPNILRLVHMDVTVQHHLIRVREGTATPSHG